MGNKYETFTCRSVSEAKTCQVTATNRKKCQVATDSSVFSRLVDITVDIVTLGSILSQLQAFSTESNQSQSSIVNSCKYYGARCHGELFIGTPCIIVDIKVDISLYPSILFGIPVELM